MTTENYHAPRALSTAVAPRGAARPSPVAQCESRIVTGSPPEPTFRPGPRTTSRCSRAARDGCRSSFSTKSTRVVRRSER